MSKKKEKKIKIRRNWDMSPVTRIKHSRKPYDRSRERQETIKTFREDDTYED
jgi:hypothetical protein